MKRAIEKQYAIELGKLKNGLHVFDFDIGKDFFSQFEYSQVHIGEVKVTTRINKYETHLDAKFGFEGNIQLDCDRCTEPYNHKFSSEHRVIYSYNPKMHSDLEEVVVISQSAATLDLAKDFYDFISLEVPIRKVPPAAVHECSPEVLAVISANPGGESEEEEEEDDDLEEDDDDWEEEDDGVEEVDDKEEEDDFEEEEWEDEDEEDEKDLEDNFEDDEEEDKDVEIF